MQPIHPPGKLAERQGQAHAKAKPALDARAFLGTEEDSLSFDWDA